MKIMAYRNLFILSLIFLVVPAHFAEKELKCNIQSKQNSNDEEVKVNITCPSENHLYEHFETVSISIGSLNKNFFKIMIKVELLLTRGFF